MIDRSQYSPALPQNYPFINVETGMFYWSSIIDFSNTIFASIVHMWNGYLGPNDKSFNSLVWPVRGGQVGQPNKVPDPPTGLSQFKSDGVTPIPAGGTIISRTVVLKGNVSDPYGDQVKLQIELRLTSEAFTGVATHESGFVSSGSTASIPVSNLSNGQSQWRGRAVDSNGAASAWVDAGFAGTDFIVSVPIWQEIQITQWAVHLSWMIQR